MFTLQTFTKKQKSNLWEIKHCSPFNRKFLKIFSSRDRSYTFAKLNICTVCQVHICQLEVPRIYIPSCSTLIIVNPSSMRQLYGSSICLHKKTFSYNFFPPWFDHTRQKLFSKKVYVWRTYVITREKCRVKKKKQWKHNDFKIFIKWTSLSVVFIWKHCWDVQ